jgi:hypothetical protein
MFRNAYPRHTKSGHNPAYEWVLDRMMGKLFAVFECANLFWFESYNVSI